MAAPDIFSVDSNLTARFSAGQAGVQLPFPATWTSVRIGILFSVQDSGGNILGTPLFILGLTSGSTNWYRDVSTTHFVGIVSRVATWTRQAGGPPNVFYLPDVNAWQPLKRIGITNTNASGVAGASVVIGSTRSGNPLYGFIVLHITKGSPNYTLQTWDPSTNAAGYTSITQALFRDVMEYETLVTPLSPWGTIVASTARTVAVDEGTDGVLDHLYFAWDRTSPAVLVNDIAIARTS